MTEEDPRQKLIEEVEKLQAEAASIHENFDRDMKQIHADHKRRMRNVDRLFIAALVLVVTALFVMLWWG